MIIDAEPLEITNSNAQDAKVIRVIHESAFKTPAEANLVELLMRRGKDSVSLVAKSKGSVVGHILFSPVVLYSNGREISGLGLAPVGVEPNFQRQGIGSQLVKEGLERCRQLQTQFVVVLGDPAYYSRFGFSAGYKKGLDNEYKATDAFMCIELIAGAIPREGGLVRYAQEFTEIDV